jgi:hypothetical protein
MASVVPTLHRPSAGAGCLGATTLLRALGFKGEKNEVIRLGFGSLATVFDSLRSFRLTCVLTISYFRFSCFAGESKYLLKSACPPSVSFNFRRHSSAPFCGRSGPIHAGWLVPAAHVAVGSVDMIAPKKGKKD